MNTAYNPSLSHEDTAKAISTLGIKKANTRIWQLLILGILAGLYIGLGGQFFLVAVAAGMGKVIGGMVFSVGLLLVIVAGAELFTGNVVIVVGVISGFISRRQMFKNWIVVYLGNAIGSFALAWLTSRSGLLGHPDTLNVVGKLSAKIAEAKMAIPFSEAVIRGFFCNILVILAIIMAVIAKDIISKVFCIMLPIACFVACGFEHCVANMYLIPLGNLMQGKSFIQSLNIGGNLLPVTIGNIIGGLFILLIHPNRIRQLKTLMRRTTGE